MNIYAKSGTKIKFTGKGGYDSENAEARAQLEVGKLYTVKYTEVHNWSTDVFLQEVHGPFNSVLFDDLEN